MDMRVAVDLGCRSLQNPDVAAAREIEKVKRAKHTCFQGADRIGLIVGRRGRAREIVDLIDLEIDRIDDVVLQDLEVWMAGQMRDIPGVARREVVEADHRLTFGKQPFAKMGPKKSRPAGDQNPLWGAPDARDAKRPHPAVVEDCP